MARMGENPSRHSANRESAIMLIPAKRPESDAHFIDAGPSRCIGRRRD
jgi:hypothetical protein